MHKEIRKQMVLRRKNFLPAIVTILLLLASLVSIIYFTDPNSSIFVFLFFLNLFVFLFILVSLLLTNSKTGLIVSICITIFTILRYFGIGNILNAILLAGLGIIAVIYTRHK